MRCPARRGFPVEEGTNPRTASIRKYPVAAGVRARRGDHHGIRETSNGYRSLPTAEIAVTVADAWQRRGLGTELLAQLADRAHAEGVQRFTALVATDNAAVAGLLHSMRAHLIRRNPGTAEYQISLSPAKGLATGGNEDTEDELRR
jgi:GNAT superfamily N-acetyltransferase